MKAAELDTAKDAIVVVPGAMVLEVTSFKQLLDNMQAGERRHNVASTQVPDSACVNCAELSCVVPDGAAWVAPHVS